MSGYTSFAIWGAGNMGALIAEYLIARGASVIILSRPSSVNKPELQTLASKGAEIRAFAVPSEEATAALRGIDVLISTQGSSSLDLQDHIICPAVDAGVKLFVPAEYGITTDGRPEPFFQHKVHLREEAARHGLPTTAFFTGIWTEFVLDVVSEYDREAGVLTIKGDGDTTFALENAKFALESDKLTAKQIGELFQQIAPKPVEVRHTPRTTLEKQLADNPSDVFALLAVTLDTGGGNHPNATLTHDVYPAWNPKRALDILTPLVGEKIQ